MAFFDFEKEGFFFFEQREEKEREPKKTATTITTALLTELQVLEGRVGVQGGLLRGLDGLLLFCFGWFRKEVKREREVERRRSRSTRRCKAPNEQTPDASWSFFFLSFSTLFTHAQLRLRPCGEKSDGERCQQRRCSHFGRGCSCVCGSLESLK